MTSTMSDIDKTVDLNPRTGDSDPDKTLEIKLPTVGTNPCDAPGSEEDTADLGPGLPTGEPIQGDQPSGSEKLRRTSVRTGVGSRQGADSGRSGPVALLGSEEGLGLDRFGPKCGDLTCLTC